MIKFSNILNYSLLILVGSHKAHSQDRDRSTHRYGDELRKGPGLVHNEIDETPFLTGAYDELKSNVKVYLTDPKEQDNYNLRHKSGTGSKSKSSKKSSKRKSTKYSRSPSTSNPKCDSSSDSKSKDLSDSSDLVRCSEDEHTVNNFTDDDILPATDDAPPPSLSNISPVTQPSPTPTSPTPPSPTPPSPTPPSPTAPTSDPPTNPVPSANGCPETAFINELHYANALADTTEFVEIAHTTGYSLEGHKLFFYGPSGAAYRQIEDLSTLTSTFSDAVGTGFSFTSYSVYLQTNELLNENAGVALIGPNNAVLDFISYGIEITATDGPATGSTSKLMGVVETGFTLRANSLQLAGTGFQAADFTWQAPQRSTPGFINTSQVIQCPTGRTTPIRVNNRTPISSRIYHLLHIDYQFNIENSGD